MLDQMPLSQAPTHAYKASVIAFHHPPGSASKAARIIAKEKAHEALMAEDNSKPWYIKYARKAYRAAMHGMEVDVFEASAF